MYKFDESIFREYDIRGVVGETLQYEDAYHIGKAYAAKLGGGKICVGYDGRLTSPALAEQLIAGLTDSGIDVINLGLGPTPMVYFAVFDLDLDGGIMITGSHNPPDHNGFKMMLGKDSLFGEDIQKLKLLESKVESQKSKGTEQKIDIKTKYIDRLTLDFRPSTSNFKIAWDPGNGAAGEVTEMLTKQLSGEHFVINSEIDGNFPNHHPDPTKPENLEQLMGIIKAENCDIGFAFDGDGDRLGIVDDKGNIIWGDQILAILAKEVLENQPNAKIIADIKSSKLFEEEISRLGGQPIIWKTGHSLIKSKMKEEKAPLAGEMSAHIFFADKYYGFDDGIYAAIRFLNIMAKTGQKASELLESLPKYHSSPEYRVTCDEEQKFSIIEDIKAKLAAENAEFSDIDGVRANTDDGWWLVRASNTGPKLSIRFEAKTKAGLDKLKTRLEERLNEYDIKL